MRLVFKIILAIPVMVALLAVSVCIVGHYTTLLMVPEVWSQNSPAGESYEYKVNEWQCSFIESGLEEGFLSTVDAVRVVTPDGEVFWLNRDFNINSYSGEVTRRFVLYGPEKAHLPVSGEYLFEFIRDNQTVLTKTKEYEQSKIDYPTDISWERRGDDLYVSWIPPDGVTKDHWYKVLVWNYNDTPELFISLVFDGLASDGLMEDVPLLENGEYQLNVAVFYHEGYAYTESYYFRWDQNATEID